MTLAGIALVIGVPYLALRTIPGASEIFAPQPAPVDPNLGMDFSPLQTLPQDVALSVQSILVSQEPQMPTPLMDLPEASGFGLVYPVTEAVETVRPALGWTMYAPPPYSVSLSNAANQVIAKIDGLPILNWLVPQPLERGMTYSWQVTAGNGDVETASFVIMDEESVALWADIRRQYKDSHLVLGLVAEDLGMLTVAEREYQELIKAFPRAEAPGRLLVNVQALRDPSVYQPPQEVF